MKTKKANSKQNSLLNSIPWIVWVGILLLTIPIFSQNPVRGITIVAFLLFWAKHAMKDSFKAGILTLLLVIPFNITLSLPSLVDPYIAGVYVNYLVPTVSVIDIFVILLLTVLISTRLQKGNFLASLPKFLILLTFYLIVHTSLHPEINVLVNSARLLLYVATGYFAIQELKASKNTLTKEVLYILAFSVGIQLLVGLAQFIKGRSIGLDFLGESVLLNGAVGTSFIRLSEGEFLRAYGTFPHPNVLGGYLLLAFAISSTLFVLNREKRVSLLTAILSSFLVIFTFSRVAISLWLVLLITFGYLLIKNRGLGILIFERFSTFFTGGDYALSDRLKLAGESLRIIKDSPLTGVGFGNFTRHLGNNIPYTANGLSLLQPVHNVFLLLVAEHGIIPGVTAVLAVIAAKIKSILSSTGDLKTIKMVGFVCLLAACAFDHYFLTLPQGLSILLISLFL